MSKPTLLDSSISVGLVTLATKSLQKDATDLPKRIGANMVIAAGSHYGTKGGIKASAISGAAAGAAAGTVMALFNQAQNQLNNEGFADDEESFTPWDDFLKIFRPAKSSSPKPFFTGLTPMTDKVRDGYFGLTTDVAAHAIENAIVGAAIGGLAAGSRSIRAQFM